MKIALVNLTSGGLSGGYAKYLGSLLPLLQRDPRVSAFHVFAPESVAASPVLPGNVRTWPSNDWIHRYRSLRGQLEALAPDVVFFPTARLVRAGSVPTVVMVRNMEPLTVPCGGNTWSESLRNIGRARVARAACRRASRVIAVSRYVERFVVDTWGLPPERVGLVYHGLDTAATASGTPPRALAEVDRFVFTAGSIRPARGLEDLIAAVPALLRAEPSLRIAIGGRADGTGRPYERRLRELASRLGVTSAIVWTGHLTDAEMAWAYRRCVAFVVTSRAEACPNVALEAMSHGAAIVSTAQEPMPEFFGESAVYYSPHDAAELALRLVETFSLSPAVSVRRELGLARAATFTWQGAADATIRELQRAVGTLR